MNHSQRSSVSSLSDSAEIDCYNFMLDRVHKYQPLNLQSLTGHLSALPPNLRNVIGKSKNDLRHFLENYSETFAFDEKENVYLVNNYQKLKNRKRDSSASSIASSSSARMLDIVNGKGKITRLFPMYGFLAAFSPINTSVYFTHLCFGDPKKKFVDYNLEVGDVLGFDAKKKEGSAEYCATRTWVLPGEKGKEETKQNPNPLKRSTPVSNVGEPPKVEKLHEKLPDEKCHSVGFIQNVYDKYGFIEAKEKNSKRVFFHLNKVRDCGYVTDLCRLLRIGDCVEYTYSPSSKRSDMYEATNVWLNKSPVSSEDELYVSSSELSEDNIESSKENHKKNDDRFPVVHNLSKKKLKASLSDDNSNKLLNQHGKIYPNSDNTAEIRFGNKKRALAETCLFYMNGAQVSDLMWEFHDGDDVMFDATKTGDDPSDPVWQVDIAWVGKKPDKQNNPSESSLKPEAIASSTKTINQDNDISSQEKWSKYTDWGDSPYLDEVVQETKKDENDSLEAPNLCNTNKEILDEILSSSSQNSYKDVINWHSPPTSRDNLIEKNSFQECSEKPSNSNAAEKTNEDDFSDDEFAECCDKESSLINQKNIDNSVVQEKAFEETKCVPHAKRTEDKKSKVLMHQDLIGVVEVVYRSIIQLSCRDLKNVASVFINDFYHHGVSLKDKCSDPKEVLRKGDIVHFNYFEVIDDNHHKWPRVTLAWMGKKPKGAKEYEPIEFIKKQNLEVSCEIPSWKDYTKQVKNHENKPSLTKCESTRLLNQNNTSSDKHNQIQKNRYLPVSQDGKPPVLISELQDASGTVPPVLVDQFLHIKNKINVLYQNSPDGIPKDIESLSSDMDDAIKLVYSHLNGDNSSSRKHVLVDECCQTDNLLMECHKEVGHEKEMQVSKPKFCKVSSIAVQTFSTGDIIIRNMYPQ